jgi:membrane protein implicated in regulation of membrane protease activity
MILVAIILVPLAFLGALALTGEPVAAVIAAVLMIWLVVRLSDYSTRQRKNRMAQEIHDKLRR